MIKLKYLPPFITRPLRSISSISIFKKKFDIRFNITSVFHTQVFASTLAIILVIVNILISHNSCLNKFRHENCFYLSKHGFIPEITLRGRAALKTNKKKIQLPIILDEMRPDLCCLRNNCNLMKFLL